MWLNVECTLAPAGLSREVIVSLKRLSTCGCGCIIHNVLEDSIAFCAQVAYIVYIWNLYIYVCMYVCMYVYVHM